MTEPVRKQKLKGFTLLEVIVTIVIAAMVGMVVFTYLGNVLTRSHEPLEQVRNLAQAVEVMEELAARYTAYLTDPAGSAPAGMNCVWLETGLDIPAGVTVICDDVTGEMGVPFATFRMTITQDDQVITALFTELG